MSDAVIADIHKRLGALEVGQAKVETTLEHHGEMIKEGFAGLNKKLDAFDARIGNVEGRVASIGGITGAIASLGMSLIVGKFTGKI